MARHQTRKKQYKHFSTPVIGGALAVVVLLAAVIGFSRYAAAPSHPPCGPVSEQTSGLRDAQDASLRKAAQYEVICSGNAEQKVALFVTTPSTPEQAEAYAASTAQTLKQYAQYHMSPLVILEPASESGGKLDLAVYAAGAYDASLARFFSGMRTQGLMDDEMGMWTLLPEGNIPEWTSVNPQVYGQVVTRTAQALKQSFPRAKTAILLDSRTYPANVYADPSYISWKPYIATLPSGLIDSVGLQAYPSAAVTDPAVYLRTDFLTEAAEVLGVKEVWLITGTYSSSAAGDSAVTSRMTYAQRGQILNQVASRMQAVHSKGYNVGVLLFAADKSTTSEHTDWSYWPSENPSGPGVTTVQGFIQKLQAAGLQFWLYDSYGD